MKFSLPNDLDLPEFSKKLEEIENLMPSQQKIKWLFNKILEDMHLFERPRSGDTEPALRLLAYDGIITELARHSELKFIEELIFQQED